MKKALVKSHSRSLKGKGGTRVRNHSRTLPKAGKVNSMGVKKVEGAPDPALTDAMDESPDYHSLMDRLKLKKDGSAFRPAMLMAQSRKTAGIPKGDAGKQWHTVMKGPHFVHTNKTTGKKLVKKNPHFAQGV